MLITTLRSHGLTDHQANDDADTLAVSVAIELASNGTDVVANDTDISVLLLYHFRPVMADIVIFSDGAKHRVKYRCIATVCSASGATALQQILVIHAISGCDTTSSLFGLGKSTVFKKMTNSAASQQYTAVLGSADAVVLAGLQLLVLLCGGKPGQNLSKLCYTTYTRATQLKDLLVSYISPQVWERIAGSEDMREVEAVLVRKAMEFASRKGAYDLVVDELRFEPDYGNCAQELDQLEQAVLQPGRRQAVNVVVTDTDLQAETASGTFNMVAKPVSKPHQCRPGTS